jgi:hypothetical protein
MLRPLLNIASIACLALCVALMGTWVRSYHSIDDVYACFINGQMTGITLDQGRLWLRQDYVGYGYPWQIGSRPNRNSDDIPQIVKRATFFISLGFYVGQGKFGPEGVIPYWFLVFTTGSLAMLCQLRWPPQFTLRSLFIATTFLAIVLGMIAWLDRAWIGK